MINIVKQLYRGREKKSLEKLTAFKVGICESELSDFLVDNYTKPQILMIKNKGGEENKKLRLR